jgi:ribosomal-protein-alanine N-acetyltransferase
MIEGTHGTYFTIREKSTHVGIGIMSITAYHDGQRQELSYQILPAYWGRGIAYRCACKMVEYARDDLQLPQLVAETQRNNLRSRRLLHKLDMEEEQEIVRFGEVQTVYTITFPDNNEDMTDYVEAKKEKYHGSHL